MKEKFLVKSEQYNVKKLFMTLIIIGAVLSLVLFISYFSDNMDYYDYCYEEYLEHEEDGDCGWFYESWETCSGCRMINAHPTKLGFAVALTLKDDFGVFIPIVAFTLIGGLIYLWLRSYELTITDKRIYGRTAWGKRVDLPIDSVSAIGSRWPKGVAVSTSSGRIAFLMVKNRDEIHKCVSDLLIERQTKPTTTTAVNQEVPQSDADELKKYKELLDSGIITQAEFNAKKKQLLGL